MDFVWSINPLNHVKIMNFCYRTRLAIVSNQTNKITVPSMFDISTQFTVILPDLGFDYLIDAEGLLSNSY